MSKNILMDFVHDIELPRTNIRAIVSLIKYQMEDENIKSDYITKRLDRIIEATQKQKEIIYYYYEELKKEKDGREKST